MPTSAPAARRLVWDLPTRVFHWALALSFAGAYLLSEEDAARGLHVMFGYTVLGLVAFRLVWGFIGSPPSRFANFAYRPREAFGYLRDLASGRARDHEGHNPAGSFAIYAMLALAAATGIAGWLNLHGVGGEEAFEEIHEALANAWLALVVLHLAGVVVSSLAHRRNLVATMITGRASIGVTAAAPATAAHAPAADPATARWITGALLAAAVAGFWGWNASTRGATLIAGTRAAQEAAGEAGRGEGYEDEND